MIKVSIFFFLNCQFRVAVGTTVVRSEAPRSPFSRICNSGAVSISIFNAKKTILPCFSEKMLIFAAEKDLVAMRTTAIERELKIPILGTSELQIRWNGYYGEFTVTD